ncbi:MAG: MoaD/ThiS family protein, partial [Candidatus Thiodiazotropha sp.]
FAEDQRVMMAVNQELTDRNTPLKSGDEVAFFPPVTGG